MALVQRTFAEHSDAPHVTMAVEEAGMLELTAALAYTCCKPGFVMMNLHLHLEMFAGLGGRAAAASGWQCSPGQLFGRPGKAPRMRRRTHLALYDCPLTINFDQPSLDQRLSLLCHTLQHLSLR